MLGAKNFGELLGDSCPKVLAIGQGNQAVWLYEKGHLQGAFDAAGLDYLAGKWDLAAAKAKREAGPAPRITLDPVDEAAKNEKARERLEAEAWRRTALKALEEIVEWAEGLAWKRDPEGVVDLLQAIALGIAGSTWSDHLVGVATRRELGGEGGVKTHEAKALLIKLIRRLDKPAPLLGLVAELAFRNPVSERGAFVETCKATGTDVKDRLRAATKRLKLEAKIKGHPTRWLKQDAFKMAETMPSVATALEEKAGTALLRTVMLDAGWTKPMTKRPVGWTKPVTKRPVGSEVPGPA